MKNIFVSAFLLISCVAAAQFEFNAANRWTASPTLHTPLSKFDSSSAVGVLDDRRVEYIVEKDDAYILITFHRIIRVNNDRGIEMYNKVYIPLNRNGEINNLRARAVLKSGKVINVPEQQIKEIEEDGRQFKLFAMEGLEKGAEIEYQYTLKRPLSFFGAETFQNSNIPNEYVYFSLACPEHLKFDVKGYNGFLVSNDSVINGKRLVVGFDKAIEKVESEKYANTSKYNKSVQYKLSYNLANKNSARLYTWKEFAKKAFSVYTKFDSKEEKALDNLAKKIDLSKVNSPAEKILTIEDYVKSSFNISDKVVGEDAEQLDIVAKTRNTNKEGVVRMFTGLFDRFGIDYQIVFAADRENFEFDEELENWNYADNILFYFPGTGKYIDPTASELRYPYIPTNLAGSKGLHLKTTTIGSFRTAVASFNEITMEPYEEHAHNMETAVSFNRSLDTLYIKNKQILRGYGAAGYRPIYNFLPKDKQDEITIDILKSIGNSTQIKNIKIENAALTSYFKNEPLIIAGDMSNTTLIEKAGNKILLKIGEIIGEQTEMYQEKPRKFPVELEYPHILERKISFQIPEGYEIKNLNDLNFDISYKINNQVNLAFTSSFIKKNNLVEITVAEIYRDLTYPLNEFENFKKIINAAADFNKVTLVLQPVK